MVVKQTMPEITWPSLNILEAVDELRDMAKGSRQFMDENPIEHGVAETMRRQIAALETACRYIDDVRKAMN